MQSYLPPLRSALFIDFENLPLNPDALPGWLAWLEDGRFHHGRRRRFLLKRVYWNSAAEKHRDRYEAQGFDVVLCEKFAARKNGADIRMTVDIVEAVHTRPRIDEFILVTVDSDFVPVLQRLQARGKRSVVLVDEERPDLHTICRRHADVLIPLRRLAEARQYQRPERTPGLVERTGRALRERLARRLSALAAGPAPAPAAEAGQAAAVAPAIALAGARAPQPVRRAAANGAGLAAIGASAAPATLPAPAHVVEPAVAPAASAPDWPRPAVVTVPIGSKSMLSAAGERPGVEAPGVAAPAEWVADPGGAGSAPPRPGTGCELPDRVVDAIVAVLAERPDDFTGKAKVLAALKRLPGYAPHGPGRFFGQSSYRGLMLEVARRDARVRLIGTSGGGFSVCFSPDQLSEELPFELEPRGRADEQPPAEAVEAPVPPPHDTWPEEALPHMERIESPARATELARSDEAGAAGDTVGGVAAAAATAAAVATAAAGTAAPPATAPADPAASVSQPALPPAPAGSAAGGQRRTAEPAPAVPLRVVSTR